jgi:hypothetical protein
MMFEAIHERYLLLVKIKSGLICYDSAFIMDHNSVYGVHKSW